MCVLYDYGKLTLIFEVRAFITDFETIYLQYIGKIGADQQVNIKCVTLFWPSSIQN